MDEIITGGPAFPSKWSNGHVQGDYCGMTLRDYFAGQVLMGVMVNYRNTPLVYTQEVMVIEAYSIADAMLKARQKGTA